MKVLVIQQKMIGDVLASTVVCQAIKLKYPNSEVHYMVHAGTTPVLENNPFIDRIITFHPKETRGLFKLISFGRSLKSEKYDAIIDVYGKWESVIPTYFSGSKIRIGQHKYYTSFLYTQTVKFSDVEGASIFNRLELAQALIGEMVSIEFPKLYLTPDEIQKAKQQLHSQIDNSKKTIMIGVLGSSLDKSLPFEEMAKMLDFIALKDDVQLLFNFMPHQESQAKEIYELCQPATQDKIIFDFYTRGLREFLAVLSQCDALIGNEGGAVNMAKALDIPTFAVFSPWIKKEIWSKPSDQKKHMMVHLIDFYPSIYKDKHPKKFKNESLELYKKIKFELFKGDVLHFLSNL